MVTIVQVGTYVGVGTAGPTGSDPYPTTGPGGPGGGPGETLDVLNEGNGADTIVTKVTGGAGGTGGDAYAPSFGPGAEPEPGGAAGNPAGNGTAVTKPNPIVTTSGTIVSKATGSGGAGGYGGLGADGGPYGAGGAAGNGYASAYAYNNPVGTAYAYGLARGGAGGLGSSGGNGGIGRIGTVVASGISARAVALQYGGAGGAALDGGAGGDGANSKLVNAAGGASEADTLFLKQIARGGAGGSSTGGQAGTAGYGVSQLTFDDTTSVTPSTTLQGYSFAFGGAGGSGASGGTATNGGSANATAHLKGDGAIVSRAGAYGGNGGNSLSGAMGGAASAYDRAYSATTTDSDVSASVMVLSGQGGSGGGAGGNAPEAIAKAIAPFATGGPQGTGGLASASVQTGAANGGEGVAGSPNGGAGGSATGSSAYAYGHSAYANIRQQGGGGGIGFGVGGVSGASAESILDNAVTGRTTGGDLTLRQVAFGGIGAEGSSGGTAGAGAYGQSILDFNDITANPTHAAIFTARSYAYGGAGGELEGGTGGGAGAAANSAVHIVGAGAVTAKSTATGGGGGGSTGSLLDSGGGNAGNASVSSYAYSSGGTAKAYGSDLGGSGGAAYGAGQAPGTAGVASIGTNKVAAYAAGAGQAAFAVATADGGHGGYGEDGANASAGATTTLVNAVYGITNYGTLELRQTAFGGAGGSSTGGLAAQGGNATSTLNITDQHETQSDQIVESTLLVGYVHSKAGYGGNGSNGSNGANGAAAVATLVQKGWYQVGAIIPGTPHGANAQGGYGGNGTVGGQGGTAQASDSSTTYNTKSSNVYAYATTHAGKGGGGSAGAGGAGGNATQTTATATGNDQTGGHAYARASESGGEGGTASGAGNTAGSGGTVSDATADAVGFSAVAIVAQYGGAGGSGDSGAGGGAGANSLLSDAVSGSTNDGNPPGLPAPGTTDGGYLTLKQTAHGGAGGVGNGAGTGGNAGYGYSTLNFDDDTANIFHASTLTATVGGYGGNGGLGNGVGTTGGASKADLTLEGYGQVTATGKAEGGEGSDSATGGNAVADVTATSDGQFYSGDTATATATAIGGFTSGTMGTANADAQAVTADGQQATATATAYGTNATDQTSASTTDTASLLVLGANASTSTSAPLANYNESMTSGATIGGNTELLSSANGTGFSWASGLPTGTAVNLILNPTLLPGQPNPYTQIDDSLDPSHDSDASVLGYGVEGVDTNDTTSGATVTASQTYYLTAAALAGELELGLASGAAFGSAVNNVTLTVTVEGVAQPVLNIGYASVSQMVSFFTDDMQGLGSFGASAIPPGGLAVTIALTVTTTPGASTVSGFEGNFVLGSSGVRSPPVIDLTSTTAVVGVGKASSINGVSITEAGDTTGDTFTVTASDTNGDLSASNAGGATVTQVSSTEVKIVGSLNQVNLALGTLTDTDASMASDTIVVTASDTNGDSAVPADMGVTVNGLPVITTPVNRVSLEVDEPTTIQGYNAAFTAIIPISIAESGNTTGEQFTVDVTDSDGTIAEGTPVAGVTYTPLLSGRELQIQGSLSEVNEALGNITAQNIAGGTITVTGSDGFTNQAAQQTFTFSVFDTAAEVEALSQAQIDQLAADGVTSLLCSPAVYLSVQRAGWFAAVGISLNDPEGVYVRDTAAAIEGMSTTAISKLPGVGVLTVITNNGPLVLTVAQALEIEAENPYTYASFTVASSSGSVTLTATVDDFDDPASPTYLSPTVLAKLGSVGFTGISVTGTAGAVVPLSIAQAEALASGSPVVPIQPPSGGMVALSGTVAAIEALQPTTYQSLDQIGIGTVAATNGSLALMVAQAQAITGYLHATVTVNPGSTVTIGDTAGNIKTLLDGGSSGVVVLDQYIGFTSLNATNGPIALSVAEAENLEQANANLAGDGLGPITVGAPPGDSVTLSDIAADIEGMQPSQISGLSALGITAVTATDTGLTLSVPQALAFYDPLPITVPPGTTIVVADTEAEIASLTPTEISGLAALGVTEIEVSSLVGSSLTIDAGVTLAISGAVPSGESITFVGTGGVLSLDDTAGMAGTVYGFSPPDKIDLTDITYDPTSSAQLDPANPSDDELQITANGNTYSLQLDPSQVFLTTTTFNTGEDAGGDTDVTVTEDPVISYTQVQAGQTADGVVIENGSEVEVEGSGEANRTIVQGGGYLLADSGGTITDAFVQSGGTLELGQSTTTGGEIAFGPTSGDPMGGTLDVDDPNTMPTATIADFAPGDVIDLTQIGYDPAGSATIESGNTLQIVESGNTYHLQLDPSQQFLNQNFTLSPDAGVGTDITELQTPVTASAVIPALMYVDEALVMNGGSVDIQADGRLIGGTVAAGGAITVQSQGTLTDGLINGNALLNGTGPIGGGGVVDLTEGGSIGQAISFGSDGGTLQVDGSILPTATIYGFGGNDVIDLTGVAYQAGAPAPTVNGSNQLQFTENGTPYSLNIDPSQIFFGSFSLSRDAGTGTDVTLNQAPIDYSTGVGVGNSAAGLDIDPAAPSNVGQFTVDGSLVNTEVDAGAAIHVEYAGSISYAIIENAGLLDLAYGANVAGPIGFGMAGGTLEIDSQTLPTAPITGMAPGDTIDLTAINYDSSGSANVVSGNKLKIVENSATYDLQLDPTQNFSGDQFLLTPDNGPGTFVTEEIACFLPGTRILTTRGNTVVEDLMVGDTVITQSMRQRRLCWIGKGKALATRGRRSAATPIIVRRGALEDNTPNRDLHITKGHSLYIDGVLIPAEFLVNHRSILWDDRAQEVTVYHLELDDHDILIANGAAAESYRDDGNRWLFHNANSGWDQPPKPSCAPVLTGGPVVDAIWRRLLDRSGRARPVPLTEDPDLHLVVDGRRLDAAIRVGGAHIFNLTAPADQVRIVSRAAAPQELGFARDPRSLGVALRRLAVRQGTRFRVTGVDSPWLTIGFHDYEPDNGFRWTNGDALVPPTLLEGFEGAVEIVLTVASVTRYLDFGEKCRAA